MNRIGQLAVACACGVALGAAAQELPARKAGLWEMSMQMPGMPGGTASQHCVDAKSDAEMQRRAFSGNGTEKCTRKSLNRTANGYDMKVECSGPEGRSTVDSKISGDFAQGYTMANHVRFDPPRHGMKETDMTVSAKYAGACPAGMKPGEMRSAGMGAAGGTGRPGGMPSGMDMKALQGMSPEQLEQMTEQMKKARGN